MHNWWVGKDSTGERYAGEIGTLLFITSFYEIGELRTRIVILSSAT